MKMKLLVSTILVALLVLVSGCECGQTDTNGTDGTTTAPPTTDGTNGTSTPTDGTNGTSTPTMPTDPGQVSIFQSWLGSKHAATFVLSSAGTNNDCARCHSPLDWVPTNREDIPKTCQDCFFTVKEPAPVTEAAWQSIPCQMCHRVDEVTHNVSKTEPPFLWLNALTLNYDSLDPYEVVSTANELCEKCHMDWGEYSYKINLESHTPTGMLQCTDCHDPHSLEASTNP